MLWNAGEGLRGAISFATVSQRKPGEGSGGKPSEKLWTFYI